MNCIVVVFGTRPEFIKLFSVIEQLKRIKNTRIIIVNANQQPDLLEPLLSYYKFRPDHTLKGVNGSGLLQSVYKIADQLNEVVKSILSENEVDFILAQGDTNTVLATSIVSRYNKIKFAHVEAGLRSFSDSDPFPEEMNRKLAGHGAFVHFAPDKIAIANLQKEKIKDNIVLTGNTIVDFLKSHYKIKKQKRDTILITLHRRNNKEYRSKKILNICIGLATRYPKYNFLWVQHPSAPDNKQAELCISNFKHIQPLNPEELLKLYNQTAVIITDSGGMQEEGISLGIPVLITRNFTERPGGIINKRSFLTGNAGEQLEHLFEKVISKWNYSESNLFGKGNASVRIREWFERYFKEKKIYDVAFLGFGPAGSGVMINMLQRNLTTRLKKKKIVILDKSDSILKGNITSYHINSDTYAKTFTEFVDNIKDPAAKKLSGKASYKKLKAIDGNVALKKADEFLSDASAIYSKVIGKLRNVDLRNKEIAQRIICSNNGFRIRSIASNGSFFTEHEYHAKKIVMACGGVQDRSEILNRKIGSSTMNLLNYAEKVIYTDDLFRGKQSSNLSKQKKPSVLIIGSSHSAFTSTVYLKKYFQEKKIINYSIKIIYRSMPKPFFLTLEEAHKNGFTDYGTDDTCPLTGRVNRLSGLRFEARELFLNLIKAGKADKVALSEIPSGDTELQDVLERADIIIPAFGYIPNAVEVIGQNGESVKLNIGIGKRFVNDKCQVLDINENVVENIFGVGLASGFVPSGKLGGEKNFKGQTNGYWLYQNGVGEIIADQVF